MTDGRSVARSVRRPLGTLLLALLLAISMADLLDDPALALTPSCNGISNVNFIVQAGKVDFGDDPHLFGTPTNNARLCWFDSGAILIGNLYYDDLFTSGCADIFVSFRNAAGQQLESFSQGVCSPGGLRQVGIYTQTNSGSVRRVFIRFSTREVPGGPLTQRATRLFARPF